MKKVKLSKVQDGGGFKKSERSRVTYTLQSKEGEGKKKFSYTSNKSGKTFHDVNITVFVNS